MPVMKQLRIGSVNYDTVGEASVTQVQTSGTKIATVTIDGTATDLYAPEGGGGSGPEPSSTTPAMDGTAAVGTAMTYARADHVHPTDTSRVAASVTNATSGLIGTITNTGSVKLESVTTAGKTSTVLASAVGSRLACIDESSENYAIVEARTTYAMMEAEGASGTSSVTVVPSGVSIDKLVTPTTSTMPTTKQYVDDGLAAKQATLVSGTNIKTINGDSILGSGDLTVGGGAGGMTLRGARVTIPRRTSTGQSATVAVNGLGEIDAHDIVLFFGTGGADINPAGFSNGSYNVHVSSVDSSAFDAFAAIISPNYEVGSQASIVGGNASLCNTTTPLVGDTVTITATSGATFTVYDAASGGVYASSSTVAAGGTYSFTVECATSYIASIASGGGND